MPGNSVRVGGAPVGDLLEQGGLITPDQLAAYLVVPVATLHQWSHGRIGPPPLKVGRHLRYRPADVRRWLDEVCASDDWG